MLARRNSWAHYQAQCEDLAAGRAEWNMCITLWRDPAHGAEQRHYENSRLGQGGRFMDINLIHEHARRLVNVYGDKAELEAAQKAAECERHGEKRQAVDWRRIQAAIKELRGPHVS
jgi:hypothetical protein